MTPQLPSRPFPARHSVLLSILFIACTSGSTKDEETDGTTDTTGSTGTTATTGVTSTTEDRVGGDPGTFRLTIEHNDTEREAIVYVPESYDPTKPVPLMLNFHGFGGEMGDHMEWADMRPLAERDGSIVVYPQGTRMDGSPHWNAALPGGDNKSDADDLGYVRELVARIDADYPLDLERVYATGYSNGGMMAMALACFASDVVASVSMVSGVQLDTGSICAPTHPTGVITLHGTRDGVIAYDGDGEVPSHQSVIDFWVTHNQTDTVPTESSDTDGSITIQKQVYAGGTNGVSVEHYLYVGGDHVWFEEEFQGANASSLVWDFAHRHDIYGAR